LETKLKSGISFEEEFWTSFLSVPMAAQYFPSAKTTWLQCLTLLPGKCTWTLKHDTRDSGAKDTLKVMFLHGSFHFLAMPDWRTVPTAVDSSPSMATSRRRFGTRRMGAKDKYQNSERIYRASF